MSEESKEINNINLENNETEKKSYKKQIIIAVIICALLLILTILYARFVSTKGLVIKEYAITTNTINEKYDGLKIVQFSDLHYGSTVGSKELNNIVKRINDQNPDIVVFTGDLVEHGVKLSNKDINKLISILNKINPKIVSYAVIGNHDYDSNYWEKIIPKTNFHILNNSYELFYNDSSVPIAFIGFDDYTKGKPEYENVFNELKDNNYYTIVLIHEPDQIDEIKDQKIDLVLSGHSHLGQVRLPLVGAIWTPKGSKKYYDEKYEVNSIPLYINGGLGTSGLKLRFFNKPSINLYRFYYE